MKKKITKSADYWNPKNLWHLRNCNIKYGEAYKMFKKKEYEKAKKLYEEYIEDFNEVDLDALYEIAVCYFHLSNNKKLSQETSMEYLKTGFNQIKKAQKLKPKKRKYLEKLIQISEVYKLRKDHRTVTHILPNQMSDLTAYNDEELNAKKDELLKALK